MSDGHRTDADAVVQVAQRAAAPAILDPEKPLGIVVPEGSRLELPDLSAWRSSPTRKTGTYLPSTVQAFIDYVGKHAIPDSTTIWVHPTSGHVEAVIDDHAADVPDWREHRVKLDLQHTPEWLYWIGQNGKPMTQEEFAEHIEGGLDEIEEPDAATMLEIAQTFHASVGSTFRSSVRLQSGQQQLLYDEEVSAAAGAKGNLTVPTKILLGVAPFIAEDRYKVAATLRFRLRSGNLSLSYHLDRPDAVIRDALDAVAERISETFANVYIGQPPT